MLAYKMEEEQRAVSANLSAHMKTGGSLKGLALEHGIPPQHISDLKNGRRDLSLSMARKLAGVTHA